VKPPKHWYAFWFWIYDVPTEIAMPVGAAALIASALICYWLFA
jgi:hypothetical protein